MIQRGRRYFDVRLLFVVSIALDAKGTRNRL
jgi:hypothetical protein